MRRRNLLALAIPASALVACSTTSSGGKTSITIDTAKVDQDGSAVISALEATLAAPSVAILLGANLPIAEAALVAAKAALGQFNSLTAGSATIEIDPTELQQSAMSLITNTQTALTVVQGVMSKIKGNTATTVGNYISAVLTLLPFIQIAANLSSVKAMKPLMTETEALRIATGAMP